MARIPGTGPQPASGMLIGDHPGIAEDKAKRVWVGPAGKTLQAFLWQNGVQYADLYVTNLHKEFRQDGEYELSEEDRDEIDWEIHHTNPNVIGCLGQAATRYLLGDDVDMEAAHGLGFFREVVGRKRWVIPGYNPAAGLHKVEQTAHVMHDLKVICSALKGHKPPQRPVDKFPNPKYSLVESPDDIPGECPEMVAVDTEGYPQSPWCLSFSTQPGEARVVLARDTASILAFQKFIRNSTVLLHNSLHDLAVLRAMGVHLADNQFRDTMVWAYLLSVEPQGLKPLAWRHAGMQMHDYAEVIRPYDEAKVVRYLLQVLGREWEKPLPTLQYDKGKAKVRQPQNVRTRVQSILSRWLKGNDPRKEWNSLREKDPDLADPVEQAFGKLPRFTFDWMPPQEAVDYAGRDADATLRIFPILYNMVDKLKLTGVDEIDHSILPMLDHMQDKGMPASYEALDALDRQMGEEMENDRIVFQHKYNKGKYFNPNSGDQCADLLFDRIGLASTRKTKSRKRLATDEKALEALRGEHPAVDAILNYREKATVKDKFANKLKRKVTLEGRIHGKIRATRVITGRISMSDPPMMAIPVRTDLGNEVRKRFKANPGRKLGSCDLNQIEMRVMASHSGDEDLCGLFTRGEDVHRNTAARIFGVAEGDVDEMKHRYPAKRVGFGVITGIQGPGLLDQLKLAGIYNYDVDACDEMIRDWFRLYPGVRRYMEAVRAKAKRDGYVRDMWGRIRFLPNARHPIEYIREEALRQSHSHDIQGSAQGIEKRGMARFWAWQKAHPDVWSLLQIHDELIVEFPDAKEGIVEKALKKCMTADSHRFKVPITVGWSVGQSWGDL